MDKLFELIQVALGVRSALSFILSQDDWKFMFLSSQKQSVVGIAFEGVKLLPENQWPPKSLLYEWLGIVNQIKSQNVIAYKKSVELTKLFANAGFKSCILKGQGNAMMYDNPYCRTPGDIDIWIKGERNIITNFVKDRTPNVFEQYHHIDFPIFKEIPVEVHYTPCKLLSPISNRRFQHFCNEKAKEQFNHKIELPDRIGMLSVPMPLFNAIFQLCHIMNHFFVEGIGLRHFVDYFFVLKQVDDGCESDVVNDLFKKFGLLRFASGVMWVEKMCLGLNDKYLLVEPDERRGVLILNEMLKGGNFGHYDERYKSRNKGYIARGATDVYRLLKLSTVFPSESFWKIYRKIENQRWKI